MESIPINVAPTERMIIVTIPADEPLGKSDRDFTNVAAFAINLDGQVIDAAVKTCFPPIGRLGVLHGGLLFLNDFRSPLSKEDVNSLAVETTKVKLQKKRKGLENWFTLVWVAHVPKICSVRVNLIRSLT